MSGPTPEQVMIAFVKLRDQRAALKKRWEEMDEKMDADMERLKGWLLAKMNEAGTETFKNDAGTAYISETYRAGCGDWPTFWGWCAQNNRVDLLEKRILSKGIQEYVEEHKELPPGVNVQIKREVIVRRA